jgi:hypothetical protein
MQLHAVEGFHPILQQHIRMASIRIINLVETRYYNPADAFYAAPGSLPYYDLPDLLQYLKASGTEIESIEKIIL